MAGAKLTMLNSMGGADFAASLEQHRRWGIDLLDLKDSIFGKGIIDLDDDEVARAAGMIERAGLSVATLSTGLFHGAVEDGERFFAAEYLDRVERIVRIAVVLKPRAIRLLAGQTRRRGELLDAVAYLRQRQPWVIPMYSEAIDRIHAAGFLTLLENEVGQCFLSRPAEVGEFFAALGCGPEKVRFMWDIQNLWQMGSFPSLAAYRSLQPLIGQVHVKGGMTDLPGGPLHWASSLADASWPVVEIVRQVVADGVSPILCLNPSHGAKKAGYDYANVTRRDIEFLRQHVPGVE